MIVQQKHPSLSGLKFPAAAATQRADSDPETILLKRIQMATRYHDSMRSITKE